MKNRENGFEKTNEYKNLKKQKMKKYLIVLLGLMLMNSAFAQDKKPKMQTIVIQTSAECGQCKDRLEEMFNYTKGVKFAELNLDDKKITVKFQTSKISLAEIKQKIVDLGYDADEMKANPVAQKKLPACCQPGGMKKQ